MWRLPFIKTKGLKEVWSVQAEPDQQVNNIQEENKLKNINSVCISLVLMTIRDNVKEYTAKKLPVPESEIII